MSKNKIILLVFSLFLLITACAPAPPAETPTPTLAPTLTPTVTNTLLPTKTPSPTVAQSWTPPPKLSQEEANELLLELYETNGGCEMPCWWGIVPGETPWETALELLLPIGWIGEPFIYEKGILYRIYIDVPEDFEPFPFFFPLLW